MKYTKTRELIGYTLHEIHGIDPAYLVGPPASAGGSNTIDLCTIANLLPNRTGLGIKGNYKITVEFEPDHEDLLRGEVFPWCLCTSCYQGFNFIRRFKRLRIQLCEWWFNYRTFRGSR